MKREEVKVFADKLLKADAQARKTIEGLMDRLLEAQPKPEKKK